MQVFALLAILSVPLLRAISIPTEGEPLEKAVDQPTTQRVILTNIVQGIVSRYGLAPIDDGPYERISIFPSIKSLNWSNVLSVPLLRAISIPTENEPLEKVVDQPTTQRVILTNTHNVQFRSDELPETCKIPKNLESSRLDCTMYRTKVECNQTCIFGYTMRDGIRRQMRCIHSVNEWTPLWHFEKCEPFVDCSMTITAGGKYKCSAAFTDKGIHCNVSCEPYENLPAVPKASYACDIEGIWTPKLPRCATPGRSIKLVPPPNGLKAIPEEWENS